ncbi:hypothetical protein [Nocardioides sp.]|uniref:hypothetical protein n=1 Tax=Nocardioides sp. TaxID=35761 RepID=UPI0035163B71
MNVLRRLLSVLLVLGAVALLPVALAGSWLDRTVTDTDTYVATVAPLADEQTVQDSVRVRTQAAVVSALDPSERRRAQVEDAVGAAVRAVLASPEWPDLWRAANRAAHETMMAALQADAGQQVAVRIDLAGVVSATLDLLRERGVPVGRDVRAGAVEFEVADSSDLDRARSTIQRGDEVGVWVPVAAAAALAVALLVSPLRRRTTVVAAVLALPALGLLGARSVLEAVADPGEQRELGLAVWDALVAGLWRDVAIAAGVALAVLLALVLPRKRRGRGAPDQAWGDQAQTGAISRL